MNKNYLKFFKLILGKNSLLRALQIYECLNTNLSGISLELGAISDKNKTFSNYVKGKSKFHYSNKIINKRSNTFYSDLTKKIKVSAKTYENVLLFNVLEHLPEYKMAFSEIYRILKKGGNFIGSVPFIYQIHAAPNDYFRFSRQFFELNLKRYRFKKVKVKSLGFGPFIASYALLHSYLKFLPFLSQILLLLAYILDSFIQIFVKTGLKEIFPLGYFFTAKK
jgi:SAM-dependent methyltransferase|tara:strand:+ start:821 stop:1486 length:666 start_codon:yes stop_codon:yes gene_type:complete